MGCFLGCFGGEAEKEKTVRRRRRSGRRSPNRQGLNHANGSSGIFRPVAIELRQSSLRQVTPRLSPSPSSLVSPVVSVAPAEIPSLDPPVEPVNPPVQPVNPPVEPDVPPASEIREVKEKTSTGLPKKKVTFDLNVKTYEPNYTSEDEIQEEESVQEKPKLPTRTTFPSNHRYQNWYYEPETDEIEEEDEDEEEDYYDSDNEYEELDEIDEIGEIGIDGIGNEELDEIDEIGEIGIDGIGNEEDSYESFFSLSIDKENDENNNNEEINSSIIETTPVKTDTGPRDRSQSVHSVLNPVENLSQWKEVKSNNNNNNKYNRSEKAEKITLNNNNNSNLQKENKNSDNNIGSIKREISVDASLSTWLVSSENNSSVEKGQNGNFIIDERPILGALTIEDLKKASVNSSPRRSPSREDAPIIGSVGSYWNHTSPGTSCSSRFNEDKMAKCR